MECQTHDGSDMSNETLDRDINPYKPPDTEIPDQSTEVSPGPAGIGGWLLFLCIILTILKPLSTIINLAVIDFLQMQDFQNMLEGGDSELSYMMNTLNSPDMTLPVVLSAFSLIAGIGLWRRWKKALPTAKLYLSINLVFALIPGIGLNSVVSMLWTITFTMVCFLYLNKSRRVKNSYGNPRS